MRRPAGGLTAFLGAPLIVLACALFAVACDEGDDRSDGEPEAIATSASTATLSDPAAVAAAICAAEPARMPADPIESPDLVEISGLASSRAHAGILWTHNDSGDIARVFATDIDGRQLATYVIAGAEAIDWEDMAIGPGPVAETQYLYLADIGDNQAMRTEVAVYRVPEPATIDGDGTGAPGSLSGAEKLVLRYPDRPHDAEVLLVDPPTGDLIIVTKDIAGGPSLVFRAAGSTPAGAPAVLEQIAQLPVSMFKRAAPPPPEASALARGLGLVPTAGDITVQGDVIAIRTYATIWIWSRAAGVSLGQALAEAPLCEAPSVLEPQGEAIAFDAEGLGYITVSEGMKQPLHYFRNACARSACPP